MALPSTMLAPLRDPRAQNTTPDLPRTTGDLLAQITDPYGVYCVLELDMGGSGSIHHLFPVMPESLVVVQRYLQTVTPTQGGVFVDDYGRAPSPVILTGTFGRSPRLDIASSQDSILANADRLRTQLARQTGDGVSPLNAVLDPSSPFRALTGYKLVKLLSEMVDLSHTPDPRTGELPRAKFYNFAFGQFFEVALTGFQAQMDVRRNGIWGYELQMTLLKRINYGLTSVPNEVLDAAEPSRAYRRVQQQSDLSMRDLARKFNIPSIRVPTNVLEERNRLRLQTALDVVQQTRRTISRVNGFVSATRAVDILAAGGGVLDRVLGLRPGTVIGLYDTIRQFPYILNEIENAAWQTTRRIPREVLQSITAARTAVADVFPRVEQYVSAANDGQESSGEASVQDFSATLYSEDMDSVVTLGEMLLTLQEQLDAVDTYIEMYGLTATPASTTSAVFSSPPPESLGPGSTSYIVRQGDNLLNIASRNYGDENLWTLVAAALPAPYNGLASTESLNSLVGTVLLLPSPSQAGSALVPYVWDSPNGLQSFGRDLPDTLTTRTRPDGTKELVVLGEAETLLQGLIHRLQTPIGGIPDDQTFGSAIPALVGQDFGALNNMMNEMKITEALRNDPRLSSVSNVDVEQRQDTLEIGFAATARNAGSLGYLNLTVYRETP